MNNSRPSWLLLAAANAIAAGKRLVFNTVAGRVRKRRPRRQLWWGRDAVGLQLYVCPGRRHAWFEAAWGRVRKPVDAEGRVVA